MPPIWPTTDEYLRIRKSVTDTSEGDELVQYYQNLTRPTDADQMAENLAFVVLASGWKYESAKQKFDPVMRALRSGSPVHPGAFGHLGKSQAIETIWRDRSRLFAELQQVSDDDELLEWCSQLPWIGDVTKYHAAKDLGADVAKPDIWMDRIATIAGESVQTLCRRLANATGDRVATVDVVLWYAASHEMIARL
jgi:hypothetical protein